MPKQLTKQERMERDIEVVNKAYADVQNLQTSLRIKQARYERLVAEMDETYGDAWYK